MALFTLSLGIFRFGLLKPTLVLSRPQDAEPKMEPSSERAAQSQLVCSALVWTPGLPAAQAWKHLPTDFSSEQGVM